jgi:hypothetical protein
MTNDKATALREAAETLIAYADGCHDARYYWGGPTMLPRHPIDEARSRQLGLNIKALLAERERLRGALERWRSAFETGRHEPMQIAHEAARQALEATDDQT